MSIKWGAKILSPILLAVLFLTPAVKSQSCGAGYTTQGGFCYKFSTDSLTWIDALISCRNDNAQLVFMYDGPDNTIVKDLELVYGTGDLYWIGIFDIFSKADANDTAWYWAHCLDSTDDPPYRNFDSGFEQYDCGLFVASNGSWTTDDCSNTHKYICKQKPGVAIRKETVCINSELLDEHGSNDISDDECGTTFNTVVARSCDECYWFTSDSTTTHPVLCQTDAHWNTTEICQVNGAWTCTVTAGTNTQDSLSGVQNCGISVTRTCEAGWMFSDNSTVKTSTCLSSGIFSPTPTSCTSDINECLNGNNNCAANSLCTNEDGSFTCDCEDGYTGDATTLCSNIDECSPPASDTCVNGACSDTTGSFVCVCSDGWTGDTCGEDVDECATINGDNCAAEATCNGSSPPGSFTCTCIDGYDTSDGGVTCDDVDECSTGGDNCASVAVCIGTSPVGSFTCTCPAGYTSSDDGVTCSDKDECNLGEDNCAAEATCSGSNPAGSFTCTCNTGYSSMDDGVTCDDIDECENGGAADCSEFAQCDGTTPAGSFTCTCNTGYESSDDGITCSDKDECNLNEDNCDQVASCNGNAPAGSFTCTCPATGYTTSDNGVTCSDIDECANGGAANCSEFAQCDGTTPAGSFTCTCNTGYESSDDGITCSDINECSVGSPCDSLASCNGTEPAGSFTCSCPTGYSTVDDGVTCSDKDECALGEDNCSENAVCNGTSPTGSFSCNCSTGYTGDGITCTDVDECASDPSPCSSDAVCTNNNGSYNCTCNEGYLGDGLDCLSVCEIKKGKSKCKSECFSLDTQVRTTNGKKMEMRDVLPGDHVLTYDSTGRETFAPALMQLHLNDREVTEFISLETTSGKRVKLSRTHLVTIMVDEGMNVKSVFAGDIKRGDLLLVEGHQADAVKSVSTITEKGFVSIVTARGTVIANEIYASNYATISSHETADMGFAFAKIWYKFMEKIGVGSFSRVGVSGLDGSQHPYTIILKFIGLPWVSNADWFK